MSEAAQNLTPEPTPVMKVEKPALPKVRSICVDTLTAIMKNQVYEEWGDGKKVNYDAWKDYGIELNNFVRGLVQRGFTNVGILGYEGSGKSFGMKSLPAGTNVWYNCDDKETTFKGGRQIYGTRTNPTYLNKIKESKSYQGILDSIDKIIKAGMLDANPVAFLMAHIEDYKSGEVIRQRMKIMGKVSKNGLEDMLTMCYYTEVIPNGIGADYKLRTQNTGFNTGRTMEGQHDSLLIDNNFSEIIKAYDNY